jgi:hypothetical protein
MHMAEDNTQVSEVATASQTDEIDSGVLVRLIELLRPLSGVGRVRAIRSAMAFLGTDLQDLKHGPTPGIASKVAADTEKVLGNSTERSEWPRRAQVWITQNRLDSESLEAVFHRSSVGMEVIAHELPGQNKKEQTHQCYLLAGLRGLLDQGEPRFSDEEARDLCRTLGCYDAANHAVYVKAIGNLMSGSKANGFELTMPGMRAGAELVRRMANVAAV